MKPAVGAAASLVLIAATSQYYLYMSLLASVPIAAVLLSSRSQWHRDAVLLKRAAVAAAIAIPGVALAVWPYISLAQQGALPRRSLAEARVWFASPTDYLLPSALHPVVGNWMAAHFDQRRLVETTLQLSVVALALAALAVWRTWRSADGPITRALVWATVVAFVLSLGMELHWLGELVTIPVPAALQPWIGVPETWIPLPGHLLFDWLPYYASMRAWTRWGLFVALFVSVLAGIGFAQIVRSITARRAAVFGVLVLAIVLFEYRQRPYMTSEIEPRPLDTWLSDQPEGLLVEIPAITMAMPQQTLQTRYHRQPFVGAFFSAFLSPEFTRVEAALRGFPDEASLSMLRELDVRWVMVDVSQFPDKPALMEASRQAGLTLRAEVGAQAVFERR